MFPQAPHVERILPDQTGNAGADGNGQKSETNGRKQARQKEQFEQAASKEQALKQLELLQTLIAQNIRQHSQEHIDRQLQAIEEKKSRLAIMGDAKDMVNKILSEIDALGNDKEAGFEAELDLAKELFRIQEKGTSANAAEQSKVLSEISNKQRNFLREILPKNLNLRDRESARKVAVAMHEYELMEAKAKSTETDKKAKEKSSLISKLKYRFFYRMYFTLAGIAHNDREIVKFFVQKGMTPDKAKEKACVVTGKKTLALNEHDEKDIIQIAEREAAGEKRPVRTQLEDIATLRDEAQQRQKLIEAQAQKEKQKYETLKDILTAPKLHEITTDEEIEARRREAKIVMDRITEDYKAEVGRPAYQSRRIYAQKKVLDAVFHDGVMDTNIVDIVYDELNLKEHQGEEFEGRIALEKQALKEVISQRRAQIMELNANYEAAFDAAGASGAGDAEKRAAADLALRNELLKTIITNMDFYKKLHREHQEAFIAEFTGKDLQAISMEWTQYGPILYMDGATLAKLEGLDPGELPPAGTTFMPDGQLPIMALNTTSGSTRRLNATRWHEVRHMGYQLIQATAEKSLRATYAKRTATTISKRCINILSKENAAYSLKDTLLQAEIKKMAVQFLEGKPLTATDLSILPEGATTLGKVMEVFSSNKDIQKLIEYFEKNLDARNSPVEEIVTALSDLGGAKVWLKDEQGNLVKRARLTLGVMGINPEKFDLNDQNDLATLMLLRMVNRLYKNEEANWEKDKQFGPLSHYHQTIADEIAGMLDRRDLYNGQGIANLLNVFKKDPDEKFKGVFELFGFDETEFEKYDFITNWPPDVTPEELNRLQAIYNANPETTLDNWQKSVIYQLLKESGKLFEISSKENGVYRNNPSSSTMFSLNSWWEMVLFGENVYFPKAPLFDKPEPQKSAHKYGPGSKYAYPSILSYFPLGIGSLLSAGGSHLFGLGGKKVKIGNKIIPLGGNYPRHLKDPGGALGTLFSLVGSFDMSDLWDSGLRGRPRDYFDEDSDLLEFWTGALGLGGIYGRPELAGLRRKMERRAPRPHGLFEIEVYTLYPQTIALGLEALGTYNYTKDQTLVLMEKVGGVSIDSYSKQASIDKNDFTERDEYRNNPNLYNFIINNLGDHPNFDRIRVQAERYLQPEVLVVEGVEHAYEDIRKGEMTKSLKEDMVEILHETDDVNITDLERFTGMDCINEVADLMMAEDQRRRADRQAPLTMEDILDRLFVLDMKMPADKLNLTETDTGIAETPPYIEINNERVSSQKVRKMIEYFYIARFRRVLEMGAWGKEERFPTVEEVPEDEGRAEYAAMRALPDDDPNKGIYLRNFLENWKKTHGNYSKTAQIQIGSTFTGYPLLVKPINPLNDTEMYSLFSSKVLRNEDGTLNLLDGRVQYDISQGEVNGSMQDNIVGSLKRLQDGKDLYWDYIKRLNASGVYMEMSKVRKKTWQAIDRWDVLFRWAFFLSFGLAVMNPALFGGLFSANAFLAHVGWSFAVSPFIKRQSAGWSRRERAAIEALNQLISIHDEFKAITTKPPDYETLKLYQAKKENIKEMWKSVLTDMKDAPYIANNTQKAALAILGSMGL